jgi:flagellar hook-associated protein 1 FlgK
MGFAANISGTLAGLIPAQQALVSGLAGPAAAKLNRPTKLDKRTNLTTEAMTPAGELLPIGLIREAVQECLQESIQDAAGSLHALMADDEIVDLLHKLMGRPGDSGTVGRSLQDVVDSFSALAAKDGQPEDVVAAINRFTDKLKSITSQLAEIKDQTGDKLDGAVAKANGLLAQINETNRQISVAGATGSSASAAQEAQKHLLAELAKTIDFASFRRGDGSIALYTKQGVALAGDGAGLEATEQGIMAGGTNITEQLERGALHGYLHNRDTALPGVQSQLDTLAQTLQSRINQLSNRAIGGQDARAAYHGSRRFADPAGHRIGLGGGDTEILLQEGDGRALARGSLAAIVKSYRRQSGLPGGAYWPIGQVAAALARWIARFLPEAGQHTVSLSPEGTMIIELPRGLPLQLVLRDRRSLALQSASFAADKALGVAGSLALCDGLGNRFAVSLTVADTLNSTAGKLSRLDGLSAKVMPSEQGGRLQIGSLAGSDLIGDPDGDPNGAMAALNLVPADDQQREDVAVHLVTAAPANHLISRPFSQRGERLGLQGSLLLRNKDGAMLGFQTVTPDWTLDQLVERLANASDPRITAALIGAGNQSALRIATLTQDDRFLIEGFPEGWQTSPRFGFLASGGDLAISLAGTALPRYVVAPGSNFTAIAEQLNGEQTPWSQAGLRAQVLRAGAAEVLDVGHRGGLPLVFDGSAVGPAAGQLDFRYNLRDQLGLCPASTEVVPGLANFFGLNDLFVADPFDAFESKAAIGVFVTSAKPGTASALALNPGLSADPSHLGTAATIRQISDLLCNPLNIAAAGDLPKGSWRLANYAEAIVNQVHMAANGNRGQLTYHKALLDQLGREKASEIDVNDRLGMLMTLQQTYHDSTQVVSSLGRLTEQLKAPVH